MPKIAISAMHWCRQFVYMRSRDITSQSSFLAYMYRLGVNFLEKCFVLGLYYRSH